MSEPAFLISYEGGDANRHAIEAKLYGQSLQGIDRMVSDCILICSYTRLPKRGERAPLILKVKESKAGSFQSPGYYQEISDLLAIGVPIMQAIGPEIISQYVAAIIDKFIGRESAVELAIRTMGEMHDKAIQGMGQMHRDALEAMDRKDARMHEEQMGIQDILRRAISGSGGAAVDYVAPVGRTVDIASFSAEHLPAVVVNKEDAEAIRESQKLDWKPIAQAQFRTDGFKFHSNGLSVENPEGSGYMMAEVDDPEFDEESNRYTMAAQKRALIEVEARKGYKNGVLAKIKILQFGREIDEIP